MANGNDVMILETGSGWQRGLRNVLRGELQGWFGTRTWWTQILIWTASINFVFLMVALTSRGEAGAQMDLESIMIFNIFMGLVGPIGVSIMMQSALVGEKRAGTAAWVLSKPVSRSAFIVAKLLANGAGVTATMVLAQALVAYLIQGLIVGSWLSVGSFLAGMGVHLVHILFYLTLTLMLGALYDHPAPVIGIPIAFQFSQNFLLGVLANISPLLAQAMPWNLAMPMNNSEVPALAHAIMTGVEPVTYLPLFVALAAIVVFVTITLWVFERQEL